jgi:H+/gluconate symporter-like permease
MFFMAVAAGATLDYWPFVVLAVSVALIIVLITVLRVHAFMALILAPIAAGLLAKTLPGEPEPVAMLTTAAMVYPIMTTADLPNIRFICSCQSVLERCSSPG